MSIPVETESRQEAAELLARIETAEEQCRAAAQQVASLRDAMKEAREAYSTALAELRRLCRARKEKHPLFENPAEGLPSAGDGSPTGADRYDHSVEALELTEPQRDALLSAGITTLRELKTAIEVHGDFWCKNRRIHGRHRQPIEDALNEFVMKHHTSMATTE